MNEIDTPDPVALERADQEAWHAVIVIEARYEIAHGVPFHTAYVKAANHVGLCKENGTSGLMNSRIARAAASAIIELEANEGATA